MDTPNYFRNNPEFSIVTIKQEKANFESDSIVVGKKIIEITGKQAKKIIKTFYPQFPFIKGNTYSIYYHDTEKRLTFVRQASGWYKTKSALKLPFVYFPLCFKHGYPTIHTVLRQLFKGSLIVSEAFEIDKYDIVSKYIEKKINGSRN